MANLSELSEVELISVHLPKTAGSTFGYQILPQVYRPEEILYDNDFLPINNLIQTGKVTTVTKVIHGHFPAKKYQEYCPSARMVIWLRNPILLLISAYYFWFNSNPNIIRNQNQLYLVEKKLELEEFAEQTFTHNIASNYFAEGMELNNFYFVGIQEFFSKSYQVICKCTKNL